MLEMMGQMLLTNQEQTRALTRWVEALGQRSTGSDSNTWTRLLPRPEVFKPQNREDEISQFGEWKWMFKQYIRAIEPAISKSMDDVEADLSTSVSLVEMTMDAEVQAQKLYALLTSMLRERPLQLVRSVEEGNGYEAWRILVNTLSPTSKSRALALLGAITQYPQMTAHGLLEQLLKLEELFRRYVQASGEDVPESLKSALVLRGLPQQVKTHVSMSLTDTADYHDLRELVRWERTSQKWSSSLVNPSSSTSGNSSDQPVPMEIDTVKGAGKGKGKKGDKGWGKRGAKGGEGGSRVVATSTARARALTDLGLLVAVASTVRATSLVEIKAGRRASGRTEARKEHTKIGSKVEENKELKVMNVNCAGSEGAGLRIAG